MQVQLYIPSYINALTFSHKNILCPYARVGTSPKVHIMDVDTLSCYKQASVYRVYTAERTSILAVPVPSLDEKEASDNDPLLLIQLNG